LQNGVDVGARFGDIGHAFGLVCGAGAGVICRKRLRDIAFVFVEQLLEVLGAAVDALFRVERVIDF